MTLILCTRKFSYIKGIKILFLQIEITIIPKGILTKYIINKISISKAANLLFNKHWNTMILKFQWPPSYKSNQHFYSFEAILYKSYNNFIINWILMKKKHEKLKI